MGSLAKQTRRPRGAKGGKEEGEDRGGRSPPPPNIPKYMTVFQPLLRFSPVQQV